MCRINVRTQTYFAGNKRVCTFFRHIRVIPKKGFFMRLFIIVGIYHGKQWCTKVISIYTKLKYVHTTYFQYLDAKQFMSMNLLHVNATYLRDAISIARRALVNCSCFLDRPFCARFVNCIAYLMRHLVSENRLTSPHYNKMTKSLIVTFTLIS